MMALTLQGLLPRTAPPERVAKRALTAKGSKDREGCTKTFGARAERHRLTAYRVLPAHPAPAPTLMAQEVFRRSTAAAPSRIRLNVSFSVTKSHRTIQTAPACRRAAAASGPLGPLG